MKTRKTSRFRKLQEVYSRMTDTSLVPRFPEVLGHKTAAREHLHSLLKRLKGKPFSLADREKIKSLSSGKTDDKDMRNNIDSVRFKNINNDDLHHQRQVVRNRRAQRMHKILEEIRSKKVINVTWYNPATNKWETKKSESNHPSYNKPFKSVYGVDTEDQPKQRKE